MAALQEQFAEVKRRHQQNYRQWREGYKAYLLGLEAAHLEPPKLTLEYNLFRGSFSIPFTTDEYKRWVIDDGFHFGFITLRFKRNFVYSSGIFHTFMKI